jgi:F-type H+-transporting ATPase subunit delta
VEKVTLVRQYARALFALALERKLVDRLCGDLETARERIDQQPEVHEFLYHPEIPVARKREVLSRMLPDTLAPEAVSFLGMLLEHRLLRLLPDISRQFLALRNERFGVLKAEVEAARPLSRELRAELDDLLTRATGRGVVIQERVNPELIAGVRVRIGDRIVDASLAGRLEQMRSRLLHGQP